MKTETKNEIETKATILIVVTCVVYIGLVILIKILG